MKKVAMIFVVSCAISLMGGYYAGWSRGIHHNDLLVGRVLNGLSATLRGESLKVAMSAIDALAAADSAAARAALSKYARIQATIVKKCADDPLCRQYTMSPLPDDALVDRARRIEQF